MGSIFMGFCETVQEADKMKLFLGVLAPLLYTFIALMVQEYRMKNKPKMFAIGAPIMLENMLVVGIVTLTTWGLLLYYSTGGE